MILFYGLATLFAVGATLFFGICGWTEFDISRSEAKEMLKKSFIALVIAVISVGLATNESNTNSARYKLEQETAEANWTAQGCPIYKSQCGSKHPYACELKASVVGRNRIGEIFVEAYPTCGVK